MTDAANGTGDAGQTPIDAAHAAMEASPDDDAARLRFYARVADAELFLLLTEEARGDEISPQTFDLADGAVVLAFDRTERLAAFAGGPAAYAALSGREIARMLAEAGMGLGLNLEVAPSSILLDAASMSWLAETLKAAPDAVETEIAEVTAPHDLPETLLSSLDTKLATATGLAGMAYLVGVTYRSGARGHMLGFVDAVDGAEAALARAAGEALAFSGVEAGTIDVGFFAAADTMASRLARVGLRFDLPRPAEPIDRPGAPGMDPDKPPILR
ncbi:MAG: SseB family protein [Pseudomonadota bacterium]